MTMFTAVQSIDLDLFSKAGYSASEIEQWLALTPSFPPAHQVDAHDLERDTKLAASFYAQGEKLLVQLPARNERNEVQEQAASQLKQMMNHTRIQFLRTYKALVYAELTDHMQTFVRADELVYMAAERYPGLVPTRDTVAAEMDLPLKEKEGHEVAQGLFFAQILSHRASGAHLVHAMLRPKQESLDLLAQFRQEGFVDLGCVQLKREDKAGWLYFKNTRYLNAEDDATNDAIETAVDLILLDPEIEVGVLRGAPVTHPKYKDKNVFSAGINLTQLYHGQISYMFYITREMGFVNKMYRGLSHEEFWLDEPEVNTEKPWIAGVEEFAIGGGCQILLVLDRVLATKNSYFNLPARKEGIIPGVSNMRLGHFVGDRMARQGILFDHQFLASSPEGKLIADVIIEPEEMDAALKATVNDLTNSGVVSTAANRRAMRHGQETLAMFQEYMATYAQDQAGCHFSGKLVQNLEQHWSAHNRSR